MWNIAQRGIGACLADFDRRNHVLLLELLLMGIIIIVCLRGFGRLTCCGIDSLPSFPGTYAISSSSGFVFEGVFLESLVVHSLKVDNSILFVFGIYILYSRVL